MYFETELMTRPQLRALLRFLDREINTDYEVNENEPGEYYVVIFEMTIQEEKEVVRFLERLFEEE